MKLRIDSFQKYKKRLFSVSAYLWASLVPAALNLFINPFLAKNLSPFDYSIIGYFTSFNLLVLPIVGFSFISYYSRNYFKVDEEKRRNIVNTLLLSFLFLGSAFMIIFLLSFYLYAHFSKLSIPFFPYAIISFLPTQFSLFFSLYLTEKKMQVKPGVYLRANLINAGLLMILSILMVVVFKWGALGRLTAILIVSVVFGVYGFFSMLTKFTLDKAILKDAIKFCWPLSFSAILYYFLSGIDRFFLERLNDNLSFGYYNVAFQISGYTSLIGTALFQTFDPDIYKATAEKDKGKLFRLILFIVGPCLVINLLFIALARPLIDILTFGRYIKSIDYTRILSLRNVVTPLCFVISDIIVGLGFPKIELYNRIIGGVLSIFLFRYLIFNFGFTGAAWGQSLSMLMMSCISLLFFIYKREEIFK